MPPRRRRTAADPTDQPTPALAVVRDDASAAAPQYRDVPVADLVDHPSNPRWDVGDVTELAASISSRGVLEPLVVMPDGDGYRVVMGHRRLAAARLAVVPTVPCIVRSDLDDVGALIDMLGENLHRADLSPIEEATAYQQLTIEGLDVAAIATRLGRGRGTVEGRLQLLTLPEQTRSRVHHREITLDQAAELAGFVDHPDLYRQLDKVAGTHDWRYELQRARSAVERRAAAAAARAELEASGIRVVDRSDLPGDERDYRLTVALGGNYWERPTTEQISEHQDCPGHAALVAPADNPIWLCLAPDRHGKSSVPSAIEPADEGLDAEQVAARQADRAQREAREAEQLELARVAAEDHRENVRAAAAARAEWIREFTTSSARLPAKASTPIARYLANACTYVLLEVDNGDWAAWLGVDLDEIEKLADAGDVDAIDQALQDRCRRRDPHRVLLAMLASFSESEEAARPHCWPLEAGTVLPGVLGWLDLLVELGWTPSSWEAERMAASRSQLSVDELLLGEQAGEQSAVRSCRVCGCTDDRACEGGCGWAEQDLCTACIDTTAAVETVPVVGEVL